MLSSLVIEGYRCFERFEIPELRRVNLFVGRNNAGKSTVLEAVGFLVSGGDPDMLALVIRERDEVEAYVDDDDPELTWQRISVSGLFRGRELKDGCRFRLGGNLSGAQVEVSMVAQWAPPAPVRRTGRSTSSDHGVSRRERPLRLAVFRRGWTPSKLEFPLRGDRFDTASFPTEFWEGLSDGRPVLGHVGVAREPLETLERLWSEIVGNAEELEVVEALRTLEPTLERILFTRSEEGPKIFAVLNGVSGRVPFASLGEGSWRLLGISMNLAWLLAGDVILIDELDTGLHHSTLVKVWKLILTVARKRELQIFATSHSQDCLRALAELHAQEPELTSDFMLHYVDKDEPRARSFTAAEVEVAIAHDLELRG